MKALLVGRHVSQIPSVEIAEQRNITWGKYRDDVIGQLHSLINEAEQMGVEAIIFQNCPGQLATAIPKVMNKCSIFFGVIVSKLGERPAGVIHTFPVSDGIEEAIMTANPNAKMESKQNAYGEWYLELTVDPPMKFEFSHIEWF